MFKIEENKLQSKTCKLATKEKGIISMNQAIIQTAILQNGDFFKKSICFNSHN